MKKILNSVILAALLAACTDYIEEIDDRYGEWETASVTPQSSDSETSVSSSSVKSSSSVAFSSSTKSSSSSKVGEPVEPAEVTTGAMTDSRDGQTYKTVTIGTQTWMDQNLNYDTDSSFCYNDSAKYCAKYGRLYTWAAATTACPEGWHLPTKAEFETLFTAVGGKSIAGQKLKSATGWPTKSGITNEEAFAFSALPAGYRNDLGDYHNEGYDAYFWSSTENTSSTADYMGLLYNNDDADLLRNYKDYGLSVRCLKDDGSTTQSSSSTKISSSSDTPESSSSEAKLSSSSVTPQSSSSEKAESSSSKVTEPAEVTTETMTDSRDGQTYKTVTIGTQTWMAQNLNYETENSYCYGDDASNCTKYGRLYTWAAAMDSVGTWSTNGKGCGDNKTCSPIYPVRGVCPEGWHLPTRAEFKTLITAVGGESIAGQKLKSTTGWTACSGIINEDAFAFSALPAGYRIDFGGYFNEGYDAYFWSSTESNSSFAYRMYLYYYDGYADLDNGLKNYGFSVRCLRDEGTTPQSSSSTKISSSNDTPESSSSEAKLSSSSVTPQSSDSETSVSTGTITDPRDGRIYKTVTIGTQTWMAQNLNYETGNSYCYKDSASYCSKYGRLYTWEAATTACLDGWHLPTEEEFETLFTAVGGQSIAGQKLKFATGWTAYSGITNEDAFAFSVLPAGGRGDDGNYKSEGNYALFWSSIENGSDYAYYMSLNSGYGGAFLSYTFKNNGFSVRCLKD